MGVDSSQRLFAYEHRSGETYDYLHLRVPVMSCVLPEETSGHLRTAFRELYLAGRSMVRFGLDRLDEMVAEEESKSEPPAG